MNKKPNHPRPRHRGFTLVEIMVVVGILVLLVVSMVGVANHVRTRAKQQATQGTIQILTTALQRYYDETESFPIGNWLPVARDAGSDNDIFDAWPDAEGLLADLDPADRNDVLDGRRTAMQSTESMYYQLNQVADVRDILQRLPELAVSNDDLDGITVSGRTTDLFEVLDGWGLPLWYRPQPAGNFPVIESAGPDGLFGNADDIISSSL